MVPVTNAVAMPENGRPTELENTMTATYLLLHTPRTEAQQQEFVNDIEQDLARRHERAVARRDARARALASVRRWRPASPTRQLAVAHRQPIR